MANYFFALLNFLCSIALVLRKSDFLTIGKVSSSNSALELNLSPRTPLLDQFSPTGTNKTLLRDSHKLILIKRTKIPQIFLVRNNLPSYNHSKTSNKPPDKIRTHSNGGNSSSRSLELDWPPLKTKTRLQSRNLLFLTIQSTVDSLHYHPSAANKETCSPEVKNTSPVLPARPSYLSSDPTSPPSHNSGHEDTCVQHNNDKYHLNHTWTITRSPGTDKNSLTLSTLRDLLPGQNKMKHTRGKRMNLSQVNMPQVRITCKHIVRHDTCTVDTINRCRSHLYNPPKTSSTGGTKNRPLEEPTSKRIPAQTHRNQISDQQTTYTKYIPPSGWDTPARGGKVQHRLPQIKSHTNNQGATPSHHTNGTQHKRSTLGAKNTVAPNGLKTVSTGQHNTHELLGAQTHTRPTKSIKKTTNDGKTDRHKQKRNYRLLKSLRHGPHRGKTPQTRFRGSILNKIALTRTVKSRT